MTGARHSPARILVIAGSDSAGGAGIQADIRTITALGGHAMTAITAVTAQNSVGVQAVHLVPTAMVMAQIDSVLDDIGADAIKIGMIGSAETALAVAERLETIPAVPLVFDPVMVATSGGVLADTPTVAAFSRLMARATLVTPNLPELAALGGEHALLRSGARALLIKGGHGEGSRVIDRLVSADGTERRWDEPRIDSGNTHGTGCTLASAIATGLGQGLSLADAIGRAIGHVRAAIALGYAPGAGVGFLGLPRA